MFGPAFRWCRTVVLVTALVTTGCESGRSHSQHETAGTRHAVQAPQTRPDTLYQAQLDRIFSTIPADLVAPISDVGRNRLESYLSETIRGRVVSLTSFRVGDVTEMKRTRKEYRSRHAEFSEVPTYTVRGVRVTVSPCTIIEGGGTYQGYSNTRLTDDAALEIDSLLGKRVVLSGLVDSLSVVSSSWNGGDVQCQLFTRSMDWTMAARR